MKALGQVFLDFDHGPVDSALKALHPCRTMTLDHDTLQPEKTGPLCLAGARSACRRRIKGNARAPATREARLCRNRLSIRSPIMVARPSLDLSRMLPTKPSHTTTSASPRYTPSPSTKPT